MQVPRDFIGAHLDAHIPDNSCQGSGATVREVDLPDRGFNLQVMLLRKT